MRAPVHPGRLLRRELKARELSANRLALDLGVPSGRITDILNQRRSITADTAVRLGRYFGNRPQFWLDLQSQFDIALVERERGAEIEQRETAIGVDMCAGERRMRVLPRAAEKLVETLMGRRPELRFDYIQ